MYMINPNERCRFVYKGTQRLCALKSHLKDAGVNTESVRHGESLREKPPVHLLPKARRQVWRGGNDEGISG